MLALFSYYSRKTGLTKILVHLANGSPFEKRFFNLPIKCSGSNFDSGDRNGNVIGSAHSKDYLTAWARGLWSTSTTSPALFTLLAAGERQALWHSGYFIGWAVVKTLCLITLLMLTDLHNSNLQGEFLKDKLDSQQSPSVVMPKLPYKIDEENEFFPLASLRVVPTRGDLWVQQHSEWFHDHTSFLCTNIPRPSGL